MKTLKETINESYMLHEKKILLSEDHRLNEMSLISDYADKLPNGVKIYVYGEKDEPGTKVPHFHVEGEKFIFEVYIEHIYELIIWRTKKIDKLSNSNTWNERANIRKAIQKWLDKPNRDAPLYTNAESIVIEWNRENPTNKITQSFKD